MTEKTNLHRQYGSRRRTISADMDIITLESKPSPWFRIKRWYYRNILKRDLSEIPEVFMAPCDPDIKPAYYKNTGQNEST